MTLTVHFRGFQKLEGALFITLGWVIKIERTEDHHFTIINNPDKPASGILFLLDILKICFPPIFVHWV